MGTPSEPKRLDSSFIRKRIPEGSDFSPVARLQRLAELSVMLFMIIPSIILSLFTSGNVGSAGFRLTAIAVIFKDLSLLYLVLYFIWRNGEAFDQIGYTFRGVWREIRIGILLFPLFFLSTGIVETMFKRLGLTEPSKPPSMLMHNGSLAESLLATVLVAVVAISEETLFRGYLMLRFRLIVDSSLAAAILSSLIFSLGHGYEGSAGVATVGVMGFIFALTYIWRGSLVAPIVMHFIQDFIGIVLVPLLTK